MKAVIRMFKPVEALVNDFGNILRRKNKPVERCIYF
jgi:hypothetical protein